MVESIEHVVRQTGQQIDDEPTLEIIHFYDLRIRDYLACRSYESGVEIENNVEEEDDVHHAVHHQERYVAYRLASEGRIEGNHYRGVKGEHQDHPVPDGFEGRVMEDDVVWSLRCFLAVVRKNFWVETYGLKWSWN